jgi:hypothetical protein
MISAISGGVVAIAATSAPARAQSISLEQVNPCPQIYYTEPFNRNFLAPAGCPPNALGVRLPTADLDLVDPQGSQIGQEPADMLVVPVDSEMSIRLINATNVPINYYVLGATGFRYLDGGTEVVLTDLEAPVRVNFAREDDGFIAATAEMAGDGVLEVQLDEAVEPMNREGALIILENGEVYLE